MPVPAHPEVQIDIGVFGGSGFYSFLDDSREIAVDTPFGAPSNPVVVGSFGGRSVGFMPRHGADHSIPPHRINYRANAWAMKHLGATDMILPCAAGSLQPDIPPGTFVLADQVVDRTHGRADTFYDGPGSAVDERVTHVSFADPYDVEMRATVAAEADALGIDVRTTGTLVVINGPRFSTRAESRWFSDAGWHVIGMTAYPEAILCRELEMAAINISLVTDFDAGLEGAPEVEEVTSQAVLEVFNANVDKLRRLLFAVIPSLPLTPVRPALRATRDAQM